MPTGHAALNQLGFSPQVPMNAIYLTDGSARTIQVGKRKIRLREVYRKTFSIRAAFSH